MRTIDPNREGYIRRVLTQDACEFCLEEVFEQQECPSLRTKYWKVIVARYPYLDGNVMIIPQRHVTDTADLTKEEWTDFQDALERAKACLGKIFSTQSFNIGLNIGEHSGRSIAHIHCQLIPRPRTRNAGALDTFADLHVITVSPDDLRQRIASVK